MTLRNSLLTQLLALMTLPFTACDPAEPTNLVADRLAPYPLPVQYATGQEGLNVAYVETGEGPETLLFIHGLGSYLRSWEQTWPAFSDRYRCIALDLPGFGRSSKGDYPQSMPFYRDAVLAVMEAADIEKATLVGHSMGGQVSLYTALNNPERVEAIILSAPAGIETFTPEEAQALRQAYTPDTYAAMNEEQVRQSYSLNFYRWPEAAEPWITDRLAMREADDFTAFAQAWVNSVGGMLDTPVYAQLGQLKVPTLVVYGAEDQLIPNRYLHPSLSTQQVAEQAQTAIPQAQIALLDSAGHFVHFEQAEVFNQTMAAFLASIH